MWDFVTAAENLPFSVALTIMIGLAIMEGVGMLLGAGISSLVDTLMPDVDIDVDAPDVHSPGMISQFLGWLYVGKLPFLVIFIVLLTSFGIIGLIVQSISQSLIGMLLPPLLASPIALALALPLSRVTAAGVARIMPQDETEAVSSDSFIGRVATITTGTARKGYAAQARLADEHGQTHYVMVEPDTETEELPNGSEVLLVNKAGHIFIAITNPNPFLVDKETRKK